MARSSMARSPVACNTTALRWPASLALLAFAPGCSVLVDADQYSVESGTGGGSAQMQGALNPGDTTEVSTGNGDQGGPTPTTPEASPSATTGRETCVQNPLLAGCATPQPPLASETAQPAPAPGCAGQRVSFDELYRQVNTDLAALAVEDRLSARYVSLSNRFTAGHCTDQLDRDRQALSKMLNMLSTDPTVLVPVPVNSDALLYRIDLQDLQWDRALVVNNQSFNDAWEAIVANNPYAVAFAGTEASAARAASGTDVPLMFADQMLDVAMIGNLYYALIGVDVSDTLSNFVLNELEVDVAQNLIDADAGTIRAGTTQSRISRQDRVIERHDLGIRAGVLWQTFDVDSTNPDASIFEDPFGFPTIGTEAIFTLPNGLLGFIIADARDAIVEDKDLQLDTNPNDFRAVTSISCSNCHSAGFIPVVDEVRDIVLANARTTGLNSDELAQLQNIYVTPAEFARVVQRDSQEFFQRALQAANLPTEGGDPVSAVFLRFDQDLSLADAAGDLGVTPAGLQSNLDQLNPSLGVLARGVLDRDDFTREFVSALCTASEGLRNRPEPAVCAAAP